MTRTQRTAAVPHRILVTAAALFATATLTTGCIVESGRGEMSRSLLPPVECPVDPDPSVTGTVRIAYQAIPNGDLVVKDTGVLERCLPEATIAWSSFSSGGDVLQAFGANSVDLGTVGSAVVARGMSGPLAMPLDVVWVYDVIGDSEALVTRDDSVTSIEDLEGKTVAVPFASTTHYSLMSALDKADLVGKVTPVNLTPDAIVSAVDRGEVDAAWIWQPTLGQLQSGGAHRILSSADTAEDGRATYDMAVVSRSFRSTPGSEHFLTMWTRVEDWAARLIGDDPDAAVAHVAAQLGAPPEQVAEQMSGYAYPTAREQAGRNLMAGAIARDLLQIARFLQQQGEVQTVMPAVNYQRAVITTAIDEVAGESGRRN